VLPTRPVKVSLRALLSAGFTVAVALATSGLAACGSSMAQQGPSNTLRAYAQALEQGRVEDAYHLLSDEAKRSLSVEAFRRAVKENPQDVAEIAQALSRPASDPVVTATVTVPSGDELLMVYEGGRWRIDASAVDLYGQATPRQAMLGFLRAFERKRYDVILRYVPDAEREGLAAGDDDAAPFFSGGPVKALKEGADGGAPPPEPAGKAAKEGPVRPLAEPGGAQLTAEKLRTAWEGPYKEQINRIVQAIKTALPTAQIEETGDSAAMSYGAGGTVAFLREHGAWKIRDF
jgi:hypothetical protein